MKQFLINLLSLNRTEESLAIVNECVNSAKDEHILIAYTEALKYASDIRIIYLLGGNLNN